MLYTPSCVQSTKGHNLYEVEDKVAEEIVLGARKHLFLCNNLFSVMNHVRDMIDKADEAINGKVREKVYIYYTILSTMYCTKYIVLYTIHNVHTTPECTLSIYTHSMHYYYSILHILL